MQKKFELNLELLEDLAGQPILAAYMEINHLKQLYRQGWLRAGVRREECESAADHIFGMAMLAWLVIDEGQAQDVDRDRLLRMVLAHEIGEIYTGDIIPSDGVPAEEKHRLERAAVEQVAGRLGMGAQFLALWEEFEEGASREAQLARQLDRLEMAFQALVYEKNGLGGQSMDGFYRTTRAALRDPELVNLLEAVESLRPGRG